MLQQYYVAHLPVQGLLIVPKIIIDELSKKAQSKFLQNENGGIFLGKERGDNLEITETISSLSGDKSGRFFYHRVSPLYQSIAKQKWLESDKTLTFCGEWHTHPENKAYPSPADFSEWDQKLSKYSLPIFLMIVGIKTNWYGISSKGEIAQINLKLSEERSR